MRPVARLDNRALKKLGTDETGPPFLPNNTFTKIGGQMRPGPPFERITRSLKPRTDETLYPLSYNYSYKNMSTQYL